MASPRLRRQFEKLYEHFQGQDSDAQLEDITDILCCTRRNARMVLNKLTQEDWITWYPSAGRGKSSRLEFKRSKQAVGENLARDYLEAGRIEQALAVLGDDFSKLSAVFQDYLGFSHSHGQHVIRLPYYRQLATLDPRRPTRRSEQHIIRQVFSGLTRLDDAGEVCPDLSHHWEMLSATHWRFYLRPNVRFHRGDILLMDDVIQSLEGLKQTTLFAHIDKLVSPSEQVIDIHLSQADFHLPLLLTETQAKIMRVCDTKHENFSLLPNGTGPYQVVRNDEKRLVLNAHDNYFGFRPLIDKVEVWVIDENHSYMISPSLAQPIANATNSPSDVELDPGCTYLLLNRRQGLAKDEQWARYFAAKLNSFRILNQIPEPTILQLGLLHAHGLKPGWHHSVPFQAVQVPTKSAKVSIAYQAQHPLFPIVIKAIEDLLAHDGIRLDKRPYTQEPTDCGEIDIWLKPMGISNYRDDALQGWLLSYSGVEMTAPDQQFQMWQSMIQDWRAQDESAFPAKILARDLVTQLQLIPLFHCWLGVNQDHCGALQNAQCNALGWFDFSQVWVRPEMLNNEASQD